METRSKNADREGRQAVRKMEDFRRFVWTQNSARAASSAT